MGTPIKLYLKFKELMIELTLNIISVKELLMFTNVITNLLEENTKLSGEELPEPTETMELSSPDLTVTCPPELWELPSELCYIPTELDFLFYDVLFKKISSLKKKKKKKKKKLCVETTT